MRRGEFRMHTGSVSYGCVTFTDNSWYEQFQTLLKKSTKLPIVGTSVYTYDKLNVVE